MDLPELVAHRGVEETPVAVGWWTRKTRVSGFPYVVFGFGGGGVEVVRRGLCGSVGSFEWVVEAHR